MINTAHLSVETAPPISIPFRFLVTAPLFGVLFAVVVILQGESLWVSRWNPQLIGALHLINIGFLMMTISGVLFQMLPVIGGLQFPQLKPLATLLHFSLTGGTLLLFGGLGWGISGLMSAGFWLLLVGLAPYLLLLLWMLFTVNEVPEWLRLLRFIAPFLLLLGGLGLMLLLGWSNPEVQLMRQMTDVHAIWGLGGWFTLLLMATSFQLIPMFQVTPDFQPWVKRWLIPMIALLLISWGGSIIMGKAEGQWLLLLVFVGVVYYGGTTFRLLQQRKRKIFDTTVAFWQLSLAAMVVAGVWMIVLLVTASPIPGWIVPVWIFMVLIPMLLGMVLKIAPFLVFLHLQQQMIRNPQQMGNLAALPNLFQILPTPWGRYLLWGYLVTMSLFLLASWIPLLYHIAGIGLLLLFSWLVWIVYHCYHVYNTRAS